MHLAGTVVGTGMVVAGAIAKNPWLVAGGLVCGYGPAWIAHAFIEHNKPETFRAPIASLRGDYLMAYHMMRGTIDAEMERAGASSPIATG